LLHYFWCVIQAEEDKATYETLDMHEQLNIILIFGDSSTNLSTKTLSTENANKTISDFVKDNS
jgi:hypothetical protein